MDETMPVPQEGSWVPQACTLPTVRQPLRRSEFDGLFADAVRSVERIDPLRIRLDLVPEPAVAARAADLLVRETECCSFFTFTLTATAGRVAVEVAVPDREVQVLDALADRATKAAGASAAAGAGS